MKRSPRLLTCCRFFSTSRAASAAAAAAAVDCRRSSLSSSSSHPFSADCKKRPNRHFSHPRSLLLAAATAAAATVMTTTTTSSTLSTLSVSSSSSSSSSLFAHAWQGRVVAHNLPAGWTGEAMTQQHCAQTKLDPVSLSGCQSGGPLHYRPSFVSSRVRPSLLDNRKMLLQEEQPTDKKVKLETCLSIYLYPQAVDDNGTAATAPAAEDDINLHIIMNRDSNEPAVNTMTRLALSLSKKMNVTMTEGNESSAATSTTTTLSKKQAKKKQKEKPPAAAQVWSLNDEDGSLHEKLDLSNLTSRQLWNLARTTNLAIVLPHAQQQQQQQTAAASNDIWLLIESCPPTILSVKTFDEFGSYLYCSVPVHVELELLHATQCRVDWYVGGKCRQSETVTPANVDVDSMDANNGVVTVCSCYIPDESDLDQEVAVLLTPQFASTTSNTSTDEETSSSSTLYSHMGEGCEEAYRFQQSVQALPENTILKLRAHFMKEAQPTSTNAIRVCTYNILADQNAFQMTKEALPMYSYVTKETLLRTRRMPLILHEIRSYQADVMCLQEVDKIVFDNLLRPVMQHYSYQGFFTCKEGASEGCATFWSLNRFENVAEEDCQSVLLQKLLDKKHQKDPWIEQIRPLLDARKDLRYVLARLLGHIAQVVPLKSRDHDDAGETLLWVINTHLFYHPLGSHVRLLQMYLLCGHLLNQLDSIHEDDRLTHIILCGDFNSSLRNAAGKLLVDRFVPGNFRDLQSHLERYRNSASSQPGPSDGKIQFPDITLPKSFPKFHSAMPNAPSFTHYIDGFSGTLDHILLHGLTSVRQAPMPSVRDVAVKTAMPSPNLPSDHVSLVCDLVLEDDDG